MSSRDFLNGPGGPGTVLTWITADDRSISTRVDIPQGPCHGSVVIVPACGREADVSYRTVRVLAHRLASAGFLSCLPDLSGHGDSSAITGLADLAETWITDVEAVVSEVKRHAPQLPIHLIGLRLGASIAAAVKGDIASRLYWEPVTGRRFLHAQRLLANFSLTDVQANESELLEIPGLCLSQRQAESLSRLKPLSAPLSGHAATRKEPDRADAREIYAARPEDAKVPSHAIDEIVDSLPRVTAPQRVEWTTQPRATIALDSGTVVQEVHRRIGPNQLFAVETRPLSTPEPSTTVVFTAVGKELRSGSGAIWTEAARKAAAHGVRAIRADRRQLGDMLDVSAVAAPPAYTPDAVRDIIDLVEDARSIGSSRVCVAGVCAGAWLAVKASTQVPIEAVLAINSLLWNASTRTCRENIRPARLIHGRPKLTAENGNVPNRSVSPWRPQADVLRGTLRRKLPGIAKYYPLIRATILALMAGGLGAPILNRISGHTQLLVLAGDMEYSEFTLLGGRLSAAVQRSRHRQVEVRHIAELDHSLLTLRSRQIAANAVIELVKGRPNSQST